MDKKAFCQMCQKRFTRSYTLKIHMETIHDPQRSNNMREKYDTLSCLS